MLYHIVTVARNYVIGKDNKLPWHFAEDRQYFRKLTAGSTILIGRKAYDGIEKPLPGRDVLILSKTRPAAGKDPRYFRSLGEALGAVKTKDVFICGGAELYRETLAFADGVYMTRIDADYEGDAFYPPLPPSFEERSRRLLREDPKLEAFFYQNTPAKECNCCDHKGNKV